MIEGLRTIKSAGMLNGVPTHCTKCAGRLEEAEHGQYLCGLCFPITKSMAEYLEAFEAWLVERTHRNACARSAALDTLWTNARNGD